MKKAYLIFLSLLVAGTLLFMYQSYQFSQWLSHGTRVIKELKSSGGRVNTESLPLLLQSYLQKVILQESTATYVEFSQSGDFRMKPEDPMSAFSADQIVSVISPMFSWTAKISMSSMLVTVCDRLIDGQGELQARFLASIPLAKGSGDSFLRGELLRYLAELPWYPMAILNQPQIQWQQTAENKVTGSISMKSVSATVEYTFNNEGLIESIYVPDREKADGDKVELKAWLGEFAHYEERSGMLIPIHGQVSWLLDSGKFTYFIGQITNYQIK